MTVALLSFNGKQEKQVRPFCIAYSKGSCTLRCNTDDPETDLVIEITDEELREIGFLKAITEM